MRNDDRDATPARPPEPGRDLPDAVVLIAVGVLVAGDELVQLTRRTAARVRRNAAAVAAIVRAGKYTVRR